MKKAFTIVELLVVMAVIGILISLAVVGIQAIQKSQRETTRISDLRNFSTTLFEYYQKRGAYPADNTWFVKSSDNAICIYDWPPGYYGGTRGGDGTCNQNSMGNNYLKKVTFNSLGVEFNSNYFTNVPVAATVTAPGGDCEVPKGPDVWTIYYKTVTGWNTPPQQYSLYACTENGLTQNFGELNN